MVWKSVQWVWVMHLNKNPLKSLGIEGNKCDHPEDRNQHPWPSYEYEMEMVESRVQNRKGDFFMLQ